MILTVVITTLASTLASFLVTLALINRTDRKY